MSASLNLDMTTKVWHSALPVGTNKTVLLCFCRHLNDESALSWPGIPRVAKMCGMSERTVQMHVRALERAGILLPRYKRVGCTTKYAIDLSGLVPLQLTSAFEQATPVNNSAVDHLTPAVSAPSPADSGIPPPQISALTPAVSAHITALNFEKNTQGTAPALPDAFLALQKENPALLADFAAIRKTKRKSLLTADEIKTLCEQAELAGLSLQAALTVCKAKKWATFEAAWLQTGTSAAGAAVTVPGPAVWTPPASRPAAPEVRAAGCRHLSLIRSTPPAPVPPVAGIQIGASGPGWAHAIVNKHRAGQRVGHAALRDACTALRITPASLSAVHLH